MDNPVHVPNSNFYMTVPSCIQAYIFIPWTIVFSCPLQKFEMSGHSCKESAKKELQQLIMSRQQQKEIHDP
jgi:hypothetical protein